MIDDLTPNHPCFLSRFDSKEWLANTAALKAAGLGQGETRGDGDRPGRPADRHHLPALSGL